MKTIKFFQVLGLLILLVAVLAGCGGGGPQGDPPTSSTINFTMPGYYYLSTSSSGPKYAIPSGKKVKFYTLVNTAEPISADSTTYTGTTTTSGGTLQFTLPSSLKGQSRYIFAVVILGEDFDLQGKSQSDIATAVQAGQVLFGQVYESDTSGNTTSVTLTDGVTISNLRFLGVAGSNPTVSTITFTIPNYYKLLDGSAKYAIPGGKKVKFYTLVNTAEPISADSTTYTGTTTDGGSTFSGLILPDSLVGQSRYIFAVVILSGDDYDLQGKTQSDLGKDVTAGTVLFGQVIEPGTSNAASVTLADSAPISNFEFMGVAGSNTILP